MPMPKTLKKLRAEVSREVPWVGTKPYSHNIIGLVLAQIAKEYGDDEANKAIEDFHLEALGWRKVPHKSKGQGFTDSINRGGFSSQPSRGL